MPDLIRLFRASRLCLGSGLILLALWAQAIAPLAALRMPADAGASQGWSTGPLGLSVICGHSEDAPALDEQAPASSVCKACPLCAVGLSSPILPQAPSLARRQGWNALAWPIPPPLAAKRPHRRTGQPRAPPLSS
ncbi:DUF2946 domain-containing protein [Methylobacterium sp. 77]|uniref:DUF2946 domain-containing protein n=1 Tax=Methylobacterium sp. 77 TaxID=1101192 RepID=UPI0003788C54|nr:DUF2946 domain-containing protein [Methylobacterium sp. 77]